MVTRLHPKLTARYCGPYLVLQQIGPDAFNLQQPKQYRVHL